MVEVVTAIETPSKRGGAPEVLNSAVVRFAGDSGDGMQLTGNQFTMATALARNDLATFPDFPAEIRAPAGTTFGVSAFQINFGSGRVVTAGDELDVLVAMNPAALKVNLEDLKKGGVIFIDTGSFTERNLRKVGYEESPLEGNSLEGYRVVQVDMSRLTLEAVKPHGLAQKDGLRCKNMWALGLVYWMYGRKRQASIDWLNAKFKSRQEIADANIAALNAGHAFGETAELPAEIKTYEVLPAAIEPGTYRTVIGADGLAWGLVAGAQLAGLQLIFCSYPITPASQLLHSLARLKEYDVVTFQAEDEIAAVGAAIGASYGGGLGVTSSSGPGIALKGEAIGLAVATELPLVVVNAQRAGPSTGMPTKTEQSDLLQAINGRNGESPMPVLAAATAADCFEVAIAAVEIATKFMTPVMVLTDGYIANASQPWKIPDTRKLKPFPVTFRTDPEGFHPFVRDEDTLARAWVKPGTPGLEHRIGGLEKAYDSGNVSYDADNHQKMTDVRAAKMDRIAAHAPPQAVSQGGKTGTVAVVGWGSTYGPIDRAVNCLREAGHDVSHIHVRHVWPFPANMGELLAGFDHVIVPELNTGQLVALLRAEFLIDAKGLNKVAGKPFKIAEIENAVLALLEN